VTDVSEASKTRDLLPTVRRIISAHLEKMAPLLGNDANVQQLAPGKMLRTRLAASIAQAEGCAVDDHTLASACAATEMIHTASLCHDDVIDNGLIRRSKATLWRATTPSAAVLVGDVLLCDALALLNSAAGGRYVGTFVAKVREVCFAEADQELRFRGKEIDESTCLRVARGKTGPLFAFVAQVCGGEDEALSSGLEKAGYKIGTAYQLADDLLDVVGDEQAAGKTLGTDTCRRKFTLAQVAGQGPACVRRYIHRLLSSADEAVRPWPDVCRALDEFIARDMLPALEKHNLELGNLRD